MARRSRLIAALIPGVTAVVAAGWLFTSSAESAPVAAAVPLHPSAGRAAVRFVVAPDGNEARYRVREQLVGRDLPNDAVGVTSAITGAIVVDDKGNIVPGDSRVIVDVSGIRSDSDRRDGYVRRRLLEVEQHPTVELTPTAIRGVPSPLPTSGAVGPQQLQMTGNLTVRGVTRPTTWNVTARYQDGQVTGTARTAFTFADFSIAQPRVPILLSVADTIVLEYDFHLVAQR